MDTRVDHVRCVIWHEDRVSPDKDVSSVIGVVVAVGVERSVVAARIAGTSLTCSPERFFILALEHQGFHTLDPGDSEASGAYGVVSRYMGTFGPVGNDVGAFE